ncbi:hypothetical protein [Mycobacterium sp. P7213]|uniref:hypothetical protein n=1 Tax=Mycobacterium sp. P7213 TaxID=2478465 RepID=UPI000F639393|nr:hypothetical protein [Mycobacterium sp. P7213]
MASRRTAPLPAGKYARPAPVDPELRRLCFTDEGGRTRTFSFDDVDGPAELIGDLVTALANGSQSGGRWRTLATVDAAVGAARQLLTYLRTEFPEVHSIADFGPEMWWAWRAAKESQTRWPGQVNLMRAVLSESPRLPETTRKAMRAKAVKPRKRLPENDSYSRDEFGRIRSTARSEVRRALSRIRTNTEKLRQYRETGDVGDGIIFNVGGTQWSTGSLLEYLSRNGMLPSQYLANRVVLKGCFDLAGVSNPAQALFPSIREIYCLMVVLVCERGFNLSVMDNLTVTAFRASDGAAEGSVYTVNTDKPRRGTKRYSAEIFAAEAGKLWDNAVSLTESCRTALAALGTPSEKLLIAHRHKNRAGFGPFRQDWLTAGIGDHYMTDAGLLADDGTPLRVSLRRLRLSEQVLNQHARQNSESISEDTYRTPDPTTAEGAAETIIDGQADAVAHAKATVTIRSLSAAEMTAARTDPETAATQLGIPLPTLKLLLAGNLDTATTACTDFLNSPFAATAGEPCPASFFACFTCTNAVVTPDHLPRLVTLLDALDYVATLVAPARWETDYRDHYVRLQAILDQNATNAEIGDARSHVTDADRDVVTALIGRNLDA